MNNAPEVLSSPFFGISITLISFYIGYIINQKIKLYFLSPFILSSIFICLFLTVFKIPLAYYSNGGNAIKLLITASTCSIGMAMYTQLKTIKENILNILVGTAVGSITSILSVFYLCKLFNVDEAFKNSIIPKSVTLSVALDLSTSNGGMNSITVICVVLTGIFGAMFSPILIKIFKIKDPAIRGIAIGTTSHTVGTAKAIEIGETEGVLSGTSMGITALVTVIIYFILK